MIRVCYFVCITALSLWPATGALAEPGASLLQDAQADALTGLQEPLELRLAGYELQPETDPGVPEDRLIFSPLAPVAVEAQPVKLPKDQQPD